MGVVRRALADDDDNEDNDAIIPAPAKPRAVPDIEDDGLDDEDEDESTGRSTAIGIGRAGQSRTRSLGSEFAREFKFEKGVKHLIRFLEDASFASYRQHWLERKGKKSYICIGKGCPLCATGDRASGKFAFNIYSYDSQEVKALIAGPMLLELIEDEVSALTTGDLTSHYWALGRSGKMNKTTYSLSVVKERDLEEDYGITPADGAAALRGLVLYKPSIFVVPPLAELKKRAKELLADESEDEDDDDD